MAQYNLIFQGEIVDGAALDEVKANVAKLFNADAAKTEQLFSGKPIVIKKNLDEDTCQKYISVLKKSGAIVKQIPIQTASQEIPNEKTDTREDTATAEITPPPAPSTATSGGLSSALSALVNYNQAQQTPENSGNLIIDKPVESVEIEDITHLSMSDAQTGSLEEFSIAVSPVELPDISSLSMSEAQSGTLEEFAAEIIPLELPDISSLSMSEAQQGSLEGVEKKPEPVAIPDISHLKFS